MQVTYRFLTGAQWGIKRSSEKMRTERMPDPEGVLHHQAGNPRHTVDAIVAFRELNDAALNKGYWCVPYDVLVHEQHVGEDRVITIGEGRGPYMSGATRDRNEESEAVCALGYYHPGHQLSAKPSEYMIEGLIRGFVYAMEQGWLARNASIYGHRDNPSHPNDTGCPGDYLQPHLPYIRTQVAQRVQESNMHAFVPRPSTITPRIVDTRGTPGPNFDRFIVRANQNTEISVPGGVGKQFAIVNLTVTLPAGPGFMIAWGNGDRPNESKLNWAAQQTIANEITVELAPNGKFFVFTPVNTHLIVDLVGYYQAFSG